MGANTAPLSKIVTSLKRAAETLRKANVLADTALTIRVDSLAIERAFSAHGEALRALAHLREAEGIALGLGPIDLDGVYGLNDLATSIRACDRLVEFLAAFGPVADRLHLIVRGIDAYTKSIEEAESKLSDLSP